MDTTPSRRGPPPALAARCSGIVNISLLYVPVVAWLYANYRALRKLAGT
jgi:hypothetical protein